MSNHIERMDFLCMEGMNDEETRRVRRILEGPPSQCPAGQPQFAWLLQKKQQDIQEAEDPPAPAEHLTQAPVSTEVDLGITFGVDNMPPPPHIPHQAMPIPYGISATGQPMGPIVTFGGGAVTMVPQPQHPFPVPMTLVSIAPPHPGMAYMPIAAHPYQLPTQIPVMSAHPHHPVAPLEAHMQPPAILPAVAPIAEALEHACSPNSDNSDKSAPSVKPYERRNKKRRPPDYYQKLAQNQPLHEMNPDQHEAQEIDHVLLPQENMSSQPPPPQQQIIKEPSSVPTDVNRNIEPNLISAQQTCHVPQQSIQEYSDDTQHIQQEIQHIQVTNENSAECTLTNSQEGNVSVVTNDTGLHQGHELPASLDIVHNASQQNIVVDSSSNIDTSTQSVVYNKVIDASDSVAMPESCTPQKSPIAQDFTINVTSHASATSPCNNVVESQNLVNSQPPVSEESTSPVAGVTKDNAPSSTGPQSVSTVAPPHGAEVPKNSVESTPPPPPPKAPAPAKPSSWAGLFSGTRQAQNATVIYTSITPTPQAAPSASSPPNCKVQPKLEKKEVVKEMVAAEEDKSAKKLGDILRNYPLNHKSISLQPRGLNNTSVWCYINATLQALLACPPFYHLIKNLPSVPALTRGPTSTPVIDIMVEFVNEFTPMAMKAPDGKALNAKGTVKMDINTGKPFEPVNVYDILKLKKYDSAFKHGRQEDAEEFLSCILNGLHDEITKAVKVAEGSDQDEASSSPATNGDCHVEESEIKNDEENEAEEDGWEQVGPKNKSVITRNVACDDNNSAISDIFRGKIRSIVQQPGERESATLQPFFSLQLDMQNEKVRSVWDALEQLVSKESIEGFTSTKTRQQVEATRRIMLEDLPPVLVLHMKCFVYDKNGGSQKVTKHIEYSVDLEISKELLAPNVKSKYAQVSSRKYKLFAVVNHHGPRAVGGHYTTYTFHPGINGWIHFDDNIIRSVTLPQVMKYSPPKVPYLLYYRKVELN